MQNAIRKSIKIVSYGLLAIVAFVLSFLYSGSRYMVFNKEAASEGNSLKGSGDNSPSFAPYAYADTPSEGSLSEGSGSGGEGSAAASEGGDGSSSSCE